MQTAAPAEWKRDLIPVVPAAGRFKRFGLESGQRAGPPIVEINPRIEAMKEAWGRCGHDGTGKFDWKSEYQRMLDEIGDSGCTAKDIELFSVALARFQNETKFSERAGLYLSALMNNCPSDEFTIITRHLIVGISYLGCLNTKTITVEGNLADGAGWNMQGGSLVVNGDAAKFAGAWMSGGAISLNGNAEGDLGHSMRGGAITVAGNAGNRTGWQMWGGSIAIEGDTGIALGAWMLDGSITVKGNAGAIAGMDMGRGKIVVEGDAGEGVGQNMTDGEIRISGAFSLSKMFKGGRIFHGRELISGK
jgi:hypothetical protein